MMPEPRTATVAPTNPVVRDVGEIVKGAEIYLRTHSPSLVIGDSRHFAVAVADGSGKIVWISRAGLIGTAATTVERILETIGPLNSGDVVLTNDPFAGGNHVHDFTLLTPLSAGENVGYAMARFHTADFAGDLLGSFNPTANSVWEEAALVPPMKVGRFGNLEADILALLAFNSRLPDMFRADMQAGREALRMVDVGVSRVIDGSGIAGVCEAMSASLNACEHRLAGILEEAGDGTWSADGAIENCCTQTSILNIHLKLQITSGFALFDFAGTHDAVHGFVNSTIGNSTFATLLPVLPWLAKGQANAGILRRLSVMAPAGSLVSAPDGSATGWGPYRTAREIARLSSEVLKAAGLSPSGFEHWVAEPRIAFMLPACASAGCPLSNRLSLDTYASRYSSTLMEV